MNPASTMKLLTTYAALNLLGPRFSGAPRCMPRRARTAPSGRRPGSARQRRPEPRDRAVLVFVHRLRGLGLRQIHGNLVLDKSAFEPDVASGASLDGNDLRPYNVTPDALLVNFKTLSLDFVPDRRPLWRGSSHTGTGRGTAARQRTLANAPAATGASAEGGLQQSVGTAFHRTLFARLRRADLARQSARPHALRRRRFRALWEAAGGTWNGHVREARRAAWAIELLAHESPPLSEIVRDINKFSNNVMARQVFLTLGAPDPDHRASPSVGTSVTAWLTQTGLSMPELVLENGCGLSRRERISADSLAACWRHAYAGPRMPESSPLCRSQEWTAR